MNNKQEILDKLEKANSKLKMFDLYAKLVLVGGSYFVLKNLIPRSTSDIDFINKVNKEVHTVLNEFAINDRVVTFEATFGEWDTDLEKIKEYTFSNIKLYSVSVERMMASRFFSSKRFADVEYIFLNHEFDLVKLEKMVWEIKGYTDPIYKREFLGNVSSIKELYIKKGLDYENSNVKKLSKQWA